MDDEPDRRINGIFFLFAASAQHYRRRPDPLAHDGGAISTGGALYIHGRACLRQPVGTVDHTLVAALGADQFTEFLQRLTASQKVFAELAPFSDSRNPSSQVEHASSGFDA